MAHPGWKITYNFLFVNNELIWVEVTIVRHQPLARVLLLAPHRQPLLPLLRLLLLAQPLHLALVRRERAIQVEEKLKLTKLKKVKEAEARVELETELERINALEDAKVAEGKHVLLQHRDLLKNQIDQKRFEGAASQFNKKQEKMMAERAEAQYQAMLSEQMTKTMANMEKFSQATKFGS